MANITTCPRCGCCYEAFSEEGANEPNRLCHECFQSKPAVSSPSPAREVAERVLHCWAGRREQIEERFGYNSREYIETYDENWQDGICLLPDGHDGEHEFTDTKDIRVRFTGDEAARAALEGA